MFKLILIAGGAIAMATAPATAGGRPSPTSQLLKCLGCPGPGLAAPGGNGGAIVAGNLNANANARGGGAGLATATVNLNAAAKLGTRKTAALRARANANASVRLGNGVGKLGCGCK